MKIPTTTLLRALLWLGTTIASFGADVKIKNVDEFIAFANDVNNGTDYYEKIVFLDSDLDLTGRTFEPIGNYTSSYYYNDFRGVFDGQGYVISNLEMASPYGYVGLFGYSGGLTIRNVILDSSCSITSTSWGSVGGIIGECHGSCNIENNVNMGSVTFSGSGYLYLGGIAGYLSSSYSYDSTVKNCANYGDITHSGTNKYSDIGGVVGYSYGYSGYSVYLGYSTTKRAHICNSLNHGTITYIGTTSNDLRLGGIVGYTYRTIIENCVSGGKISSTYSRYIGSIVGFIDRDASINCTYFTSELSGYGKYGYGNPDSEFSIFSYDSTSFNLSETVSIGNYTGNSLISALNAAADYYIIRDYSHWLLNKNNNIATFTVNERTNPIKMNYQIILLPSLASEGKLCFDGWYEERTYSKVFTSNEAISDKELYGKWEENTNNYTFSFETRRRGVSIVPITAPFGSFVMPPRDLERERCSIGYWETSYGDNVGLIFTMPSCNVTLYAVWKCIHIETPEDYSLFTISLSRSVSYFGTTVFLDSDLDLTGKTFEPNGYYNPRDDYNYFSGTFDGQGYVISNLNITSSSQYAGLFGYSEGLTIKNVILDPSCSITNSINDFYGAYIGGIIGYCKTENGPCTIENSVNMGSVTFGENMNSYSLHLGGITGYLSSYSYNHDCTVKNCANYGDVTHSGTSRSSIIGGIIGYSSGSSSSLRDIRRVYIYNSINYGKITNSGTTSTLYLGGIVGYTYRTSIENCMSAGKISSSKASDIGSIVGYILGDTFINYTYYTIDLSGHNKYGYRNSISSESNVFSYDRTKFELNGTVFIANYTGNSLIGALNAAANYYTFRNYSHWLLNKNNKVEAFTINGRKNPIKMDYQVILLPSLASEGKLWFDGWYEDDELSKPLSSFEIMSDTELYGKYCGPNITVTLDVNEGNELTEKEMTIGCDRVYGDLPNATKNGYTFLGWFTDKDGRGELVTSNMAVKTTQDHTIYAHWTEVSTNQVEVILNAENLTRKEIEEFIREYTDDGFVIIKVDYDSSGGTLVIIKFRDIEDAKSFVENVRTSSEAKTTIKELRYIQEGPASFSAIFQPMKLFLI